MSNGQNLLTGSGRGCTVLIALMLGAVGAAWLVANGFIGGGGNGTQTDGNGGTATVTATATATATSTTTPTATPSPEPESDAQGRLIRVGNIDLALQNLLHPYDSSQHAASNTANVRVDLEATAVGDGGGYFTAFELSLMDDAGDEHPNSSCLDCPGNLDSLELGEGESGEGSAYFELPEGRTPSELIYRGSASGEEGRIDLE